MSPSTNTWSVPNTSSETIKIVLAPSKSYYVTQTELANTIKVLLSNFDNKYAKQLANFNDKHTKIGANYKESIKTIVTNQDVKVDEKIEKQLHPLSLQIKEISSKQVKKSKIFSTFASTYDECHDNMINNNKKSAPRLKCQE